MKEPIKKNIINSLGKCEDIKDPNLYYDDLTQIKSKFNQNEKLFKIINYFNAIGDFDRFLILNSLKQKDRCVCELEAIVCKSQPTVSHHIKILERANLIRGWKKGKFTHFSLIKSSFDEMNSLWQEWCQDTSNWFGL